MYAAKPRQTTQQCKLLYEGDKSVFLLDCMPSFLCNDHLTFALKLLLLVHAWTPIRYPKKAHALEVC